MRKLVSPVWIGVVIAAALLIPKTAGAEPRNEIRKIEIGILEQMVKSKGRYLLVFMAAWCAPCIKELPDLNDLYDKYRDRNFKMIGISVDVGGADVMQAIVDRLKVNFPVYWTGEAALDAYSIRGIPSIVFIRNGEILDRLLGLRSKAYLDEKFEAFLADP